MLAYQQAYQVCITTSSINCVILVHLPKQNREVPDSFWADGTLKKQSRHICASLHQIDTHKLYLLEIANNVIQHTFWSVASNFIKSIQVGRYLDSHQYYSILGIVLLLLLQLCYKLLLNICFLDVICLWKSIIQILFGQFPRSYFF